MKNPRSLSDQELLTRTEKLAREERELLLQLLHHLREVERRKLYCTLKYKSLKDYVVKHLKYSDDQARARISAMWLLEELPEVEEDIQSGSLSLTNLSIVQGFFRQENIESKEEKREVLEKFADKSVREAQMLTYELASNPKPLPKETVRVVGPQHTELRFVIDEETKQKVDQLKGLLAHSHPGISMSELFAVMLDAALDKHDPVRQPQRSAAGSPPKRSKSASRRYISVHTKRKVFERAKGQCENCGSKHALQIDHIAPVAHNGSPHELNLRLLCRNCNLRAGIERMGPEVMRRE